MTGHQTATDQQYMEWQLRLSQRHRTWGRNVPMTDLDQLIAVEYDQRKAAAIIEYKHVNTANGGRNANLDALTDLAQRADLPLYLVLYDPDTYPDNWTFTVSRITPAHPDTITWDEPAFIEWLHRIRHK